MSSEPVADPAFESIPKNSTFFLIWRIEKLKVVPVPKENYGVFYTGDSYIVATGNDGREKSDSQMVPKEAKNRLDIHIHFWLGAGTSSDEAGVAAIKSVELDDYFGGSPVQHREVQGHESNLFLSYFKKGIRLLEGGVESGFNHIDTVAKPRLFHVKGKKRPVIKECNQISWLSMNKGDAFVLDIVEYIFVWCGRSCNHFEKIQAANIAQQFKSEHGLECKGVVVVEDGNETVNLRGDERGLFEKFLPLNRKGDELKEETSDVDEEHKRRVQLTLYQCTDADGKLALIEIKKGPLNQEDLLSSDTFIVDNGENGIWAWIGKDSTKDERAGAMKFSQAFIIAKNYPSHTPITRVIDGAEPIEFKSLFKVWKNVGEVFGPSKTYSVGGRIANMNEIAKLMAHKKVNFDELHKNQSLAADMQLIDNGDGEKEVYRVKAFDLIAVDEKDYGTFYSGDCYIIIYKSKTRRNIFIYYWIGNNSSVDEKGTVALKAQEMDEKKFSGRAVQVRVAEGKEPPQFTSIFDGKMVILKGGFKSGLRKGKKDVVEEGVHGDKYLLHVRGTNKYITRAVEVDCSASSLNSYDCFVLFNPKTVYVWMGKGCTDEEREMAKACALRSTDKEQVFVTEGQEKENFWTEIGGVKEYASEQKLNTNDTSYTVRLFQCSNAKGYFTVDEIVDFQQTDLIEDDVMLLDAGDNIFLWIGNKSNEEERKKAVEIAQEYLRTDPRERDLETPIITVKQGHEPVNFTGFFGVWNTNLWSEPNSFDTLKAEVERQKKQSDSSTPVEKKVTEKVEEKDEEKVAQKAAEKVEEKVAEKAAEKLEEKLETKTEAKV